MVTQKGYTTPELVGAYLGVSLSPDQATQSNTLTATAEGFLDGWTGTSYIPGGSQTIIDEPYTFEPDQYGVIKLRGAPVGSILSVRQVPNGTSPGDDVAYQVRDLGEGTIFVPGAIQLPPSGFGMLPSYTWPDIVSFTRNVWITYISLRGVPPTISTIATMLVAHWLRWNINPDQFGLSQYTLGQDIHTTIRSPEAIPVEAKPLLWQVKRWTLA